jgi:beta-lactamase regulating signal transducer with metallopeptidase domain
MTAAPLQILVQTIVQVIEMNLAAGAAILAVLFVRNHVHRLMGPGAAYLLWALAPVAMLAMLAPARTIVVETPVPSLSGKPWSEAFSPLAAEIVGIVWLAGAVAMAAMMAVRQRLFLRDVDRGLAGPAVVGCLRPYIVTPSDFGTRFTHVEQRLILAHEDVHLERGDARINAVAALARCIFWFNPLVHIGVRMMRADQEASCDAVVIARRPKARRAYAETLLKTQLSGRTLPVGCYWPAEDAHPLMARMTALAQAPMSGRRQLAATAASLMLVLGGGMAAWAAQPAHQVLTSATEAELVWVRALPADGGEVLLTFSPLAPEPPQPTGPAESRPRDAPPS